MIYNVIQPDGNRLQLFHTPQPLETDAGGGFNLNTGGAMLAPFEGLLDTLPPLMFDESSFKISLGTEFKQVDHAPMEHTASKGDSNTFVFTLDPQLMQSNRVPYNVTELTQALQKERQTLEDQMQKLVTQRETLQHTSSQDTSISLSLSLSLSHNSSGSAGRKSIKLGACRVKGCETMLESASKYAKRHRICELHLKSLEVLWKGVIQRFCQKCTRFQELDQFDRSRRSCRKGLTLQRNRRVDGKTQSVSEAAMTEDSSRNTALSEDGDSYMDASSEEMKDQVVDSNGSPETGFECQPGEVPEEGIAGVLRLKEKGKKHAAASATYRGGEASQEAVAATLNSTRNLLAMVKSKSKLPVKYERYE